MKKKKSIKYNNNIIIITYYNTVYVYVYKVLLLYTHTDNFFRKVKKIVKVISYNVQNTYYNNYIHFLCYISL